MAVSGWQPIDTAPRDGTRIRLDRVGRYRWESYVIGRWEEKPDGFKGWWNDQDEYLSPVPNVWAPLETDYRH